MGLAEAGAQRQQTQCGAGGGRAMVRGCRPLADRLPLPAPPSCAGTDTAGKALEGFDLTGNERHKASLIATLQETLLQREIHVLPMRKGGGERKGEKKRIFLSALPLRAQTSHRLRPPSICYYQLSHV